MPRWDCITLPTSDYRKIWQLQKDLVAARRAGYLAGDTVLMLDHFPVFTLGRRGGKENLIVAESLLQSSGIELVQVERGGNITYHGPGQLMVYPIVDLKAAAIGVTEYVYRLEEIMLRASADWGIAAGRCDLNRGVWVGRKKLGSVGVAVRRGVTFHGLALNVDPPMEPFTWINPCGLQGIEATSMAQVAGEPVYMPAVQAAVCNHIEVVFGVRLKRTQLPELLARMETTR